MVEWRARQRKRKNLEGKSPLVSFSPSFGNCAERCRSRETSVIPVALWLSRRRPRLARDGGGHQVEAAQDDAFAQRPRADLKLVEAEQVHGGVGDDGARRELGGAAAVPRRRAAGRR